MPKLVFRHMMKKRGLFYFGLFKNERNRPVVDEIARGNYSVAKTVQAVGNRLILRSYATGNNCRDSICWRSFLCGSVDLQEPAKQVCLHNWLRQMWCPRYSKDRGANEKEGAIILSPNLRTLCAILTNFDFASGCQYRRTKLIVLFAVPDLSKRVLVKIT